LHSDQELQFLCDVLSKSHVQASIIGADALPARMKEYAAEGMSDPRFAKGGSVEKMLKEAKHRTLYKLNDVFFRSFLALLLPWGEPHTLLVIGPFLQAPVSPQRLLMLGEEMHVSPQKQGYLNEYYLSLPILPADGHLMVMIHTFCERLWHDPAFSIVEITREKDLPAMLPENPLLSHGENDTMVNLKAMERRYAFENQLLRSVSLGQLHMEDQLMQAFSAEAFEKRTADPLRNAKNYCIIMNTLLRKAAEQGGVHPVHLDRASSDFARKIETMTSTGENTALMLDMFRTYCRLVRRHSLQKYSPVIRKVILTIDADLSADLSPHVLAESLGISLGYLSTLFRRETGKPLPVHVRQRRMEYAAYLLATTDLQIQTVALHCGIMDVQYFSKIFKRYHDMTPSDYRLAKKQIKPMS